MATLDRLLVAALALILLDGCATQARRAAPSRAILYSGPVAGTADFASSARDCPATLDDCPTTGCGDANPTLNVQKNRTKDPTDLVDLSVAEFKAEHKEIPKTQIGKFRENLDDDLKDQLKVMESVGVSVEGYIIDYTPEEPEDCNCYVKTARDYHVWLGTSATSDKRLAIVAELTPRLFVKAGDALKDVKHKRVRVVGWPLFDSQHPEQVGKTRYARWEVHPVTDVQIEENGEWSSIFTR